MPTPSLLAATGGRGPQLRPAAPDTTRATTLASTASATATDAPAAAAGHAPAEVGPASDPAFRVPEAPGGVDGNSRGAGGGGSSVPVADASHSADVGPSSAPAPQGPWGGRESPPVPPTAASASAQPVALSSGRRGPSEHPARPQVQPVAAPRPAPPPQRPLVVGHGGGGGGGGGGASGTHGTSGSAAAADSVTVDMVGNAASNIFRGLAVARQHAQLQLKRIRDAVGRYGRS
jgi:hypothetical protein